MAITLDLDLDCTVFHDSDWLQANAFLDVLQGDKFRLLNFLDDHRGPNSLALLGASADEVTMVIFIDF